MALDRLVSRLAQRFFEALYGPAVPLYDWVSRVGFAGEWSRWQRTALRFIRQGPTLEIGPGTGDLLPLLLEHGLAPCGLEPSPRMIARARRKLARRGVAPPPPIVRGRAEALPFGDARFGAVVATFPSPYILRPATWAEIARVLRPGGDVAIVMGGDLAPHGLGRAARARVYRILYGGQGQRRGGQPPPPLPSVQDRLLNLREETVATAHGRAFLLVGRKPW